MDVLPEQRREMRPGVLRDRAVTAIQFLGGGLEVASVPDREGVDDEAERRRSVELCLVAAITETALAAEADLPCHGVQALLAVQSDQHSAPERLVIYVAQDVPGLGHAAELLERLLQGVLPAQCLELGNDQRRSDQPVLERSGQSVEVVPVADEQLRTQRLAQDRIECPVVHIPASPVEQLVGEVAEPRREAVTQ